MTAFQRSVARANCLANRLVVPALGVPLVGRTLGRGIVMIGYTGRRSGTRVELPVAYRRRGDHVLIRVAVPDGKSWWRNFTGAGGPLEVHLPGGTRIGHAVSGRDDAGAVTVVVALDPVAPV
ncbi:hypothetical protein FK531_18125 [Rhodococcus spelaei]|uniref:DUF385 domain-containing protein n=1 Tax=Rhodococcus spelaei TaxID=2546320 RepID=A0A541B297_9NOCA|nr:hypothetical protein [Rhodococcus spelaei]TQF66417.1 hypothetical protein FK531_18125 [Rhodococcus spelaei]